jgi:actin-like ATPase involved in cell morphogenesis
MSESLGLSIGVANLVAARAGGAPVTRTSVLTLYDNRAPEVGLPEENPNLTEPGLVMRGFIERVGDRAPLVAADGTKYLGDALTVEALEVMARTVDYGTPVTIAVPAYWSQGQVVALREEFFAQPALARGGVPPVLISDASAALAALRTTPGFPNDGIVAVCDFGAGGTSVTLINTGSNFQQIGSSVRYTDFSGDRIDQLILNHLRTSAPDSASTDPDSTTRMGSPTRLLDQCRRAKEHLSAAMVTSVATGSGADAQLSRTEFEQLISEPLDRFVATVEETLQRNEIPKANLAAVATVGGGASIPALTARLSERLRAPVFTTPQPASSAAVGAAVLGQQRSSAGVPTAAGPIVENPTELVGTPPADMTQAAWAAQADDEKSGAYRPLAWSQDADTDEPVPYTGPEHTGEYGREATGFDYSDDDRYAAEAARLPWYKRTALVLSLAAAGAAVLVAVLLAITLGHNKTNPVNTTPPNAPSQTSQTVTVTGPDNTSTVTVIPPPSPTTTQPPTTTPTTPPPTTTTTTPPPTTTTTTSEVTTTAPSTTTRERPLSPRFEPPFRR